MAAERTVVVGGEKLAAAFRRARGSGPAILAGALYREAEAVMLAAKRLAPSDLGALRASGQVQPPVITAGGIEVTMGFGDAATGYAVYVHEGTGPAVGRPAFMPPVDVIRAWAVRHGMPAEAGFAVARAIGRRGLRPLKYLERPLLEAARDMEARLAGAVLKELERVAGRPS